jgi:hypothetical protein
MQIDVMMQFEKQDLSILASRDSLSTVKLSTRARSKQDSPRISTERGMQIDCKEQPEKHDASNLSRHDSASKANDSIGPSD